VELAVLVAVKLDRSEAGLQSLGVKEGVEGVAAGREEVEVAGDDSAVLLLGEVIVELGLGKLLESTDLLVPSSNKLVFKLSNVLFARLYTKSS
jgi:hypothetical protein